MIVFLTALLFVVRCVDHWGAVNMDVGKVVILAAVILLSSMPVEAGCTFQDEAAPECTGQLTCVDSFDDVSFIVRHWQCRKLPQFYGNVINHQQDIYWINVKMQHFTGIEEENESIKSIRDHIITLSFTDGNFTAIPYLFDYDNLKELDVSRNNIKYINLLLIKALDALQVFNASYNSIAELSVDFGDEVTTQLNLSTIDVSYNNVTAICDIYFSKFPKLLHLNISHNLIESFTILTFEGLAELETLQAGNNRIKEINMCFVRFSYLKELSLEHNDITKIDKSNFKMMEKLVKLNLSYNKISFIDELSFQNLYSLENIQLQNNQIKVITKSLFINNNALNLVDLSNNEINKIESFTFKGKKITHFMITNNSITELIDQYTLEGIFMENLNFSLNNITSLGPKLFRELGKTLQYLDFSSNRVANIHKETLHSLEALTHLDISKNQLTDLDFMTSDLKSLELFDGSENSITEISNDTFKDLKSLEIINLSNNAIRNIEAFAFKEMNQLKFLDLSNNHLQSTVVSRTFYGLFSTIDLHLTHIAITELQNETFYEMNGLHFLNISWSKIKDIQYNTFLNTGSVWVLDLSCNNINSFLLNNTDLRQLTDLYLESNFIASVTNETFMGLDKLQILNLDNNNIKQIDNSVLRNLRSLLSLTLSSNEDLVLGPTLFSNVTTVMVSLHNIQTPFNFGKVQNAEISNLDLSSCNITYLSNVKVGNVAKLETLSLSSNKIKLINKYSLQNLNTLVSLDLSSNMIATVQPGSFLSTRKLRELNLYDNNLSSLQFGVFDGLSNLRVLNISSNYLRTFSAHIFHNSHMLWVVSLDDNMIESLDFNEINSASIPKVTIGGNLIPCDQLAKSKKNNYYGVTVAAEKINIHDENIDGVSCKGAQLENITINPTVEKAQVKNEKVTTSEDLKSLNNRIILTTLTDLKSVLYLESSCLVFIVIILLTTVAIAYFKLRNNCAKSYSFSSTRRLTSSCMEMEL